MKTYGNRPSRIVDATVEMNDTTVTEIYRLPTGRPRIQFIRSLDKRREFAEDESKSLIDDLKQKLRELGRDPDSVEFDVSEDHSITVDCVNEDDGNLIKMIRHVERMEDSNDQIRRKLDEL